MHDRRFVLWLLAAGGFSASADAQSLPSGLSGFGAKPPGGAPAAAAGLPPGISAAQGEGALREALSSGAAAAVLRVGKADGFWSDGKIRIPLPGALATLQRSTKPMGMSGPLDDLQLKVNRGAEAAAPKAKTLFLDAIRAMRVQDVAQVLRGGERAGTAYLRDKTGAQLAGLFRPQIAGALESTGALKALDGVSAKYPAQAKLGPDPRASLIDFAVAKALDGVFFYVGEEEAAIRKNPAKQTSQALKSVFGAL